MCWAFNRQYGTRYVCAMPTNLYGPGDRYDLQNSHVLPALLRKIHEAKRQGEQRVVIWGTGKPRREFLYSDDAADACVSLMNLEHDRFEALFAPGRGEPPLINVGCGEDQSISELAALIADVVGYRGAFEFDLSKPDGTLRKLLDVSRLKASGWEPKTSLRNGIKLAYADLQARHAALPT
jgi:GDP-L-fucose synthase